MATSASVDGFRLTYDRHGAGQPVVLLHGWPGDRSDYDLVAPLLSGAADVVVPDLRGFGSSDKHPRDPAEHYSAAAQARSIAGLIDELGLGQCVVAGYDVGSRISQALAAARPDLVSALVVAPPVPGVGRRVLEPGRQREYWYQAFHQLALIEQLIDGNPDVVRHYLAHFWSHWSGPNFEPDADRLEHLVDAYAAPGAFTASIAWYRAGAGTVAVSVAEADASSPPPRLSTSTTILWPDHDPLFPREWSDNVDTYFADVVVEPVDGVGHFAPLEFPEVFAAAVKKSLAR